MNRIVCGMERGRRTLEIASQNHLLEFFEYVMRDSLKRIAHRNAAHGRR